MTTQLALDFTRSPAGKSVVYVVEAIGLGMVKIGTTTNLEQRLGDLRFAAPTGLAVVKVTPGGPALERALHRWFEAHRSHGEWFFYEPIRDDIERLESLPIDLSDRLRCLDCGRVRSEHSRARAKRCRSCAGKVKRREPASIKLRPLCPCGTMLSSANKTGLCRPCGMRKAWASTEYETSIMAARVKRRKRCLRCGQDGVSKGAKYHAACWIELQAAQNSVGNGRAEGPVLSAADQTE